MLGIVAAVFFWTILFGILLGIVSAVASITFVIVLIGSAAHDADGRFDHITFCFDHPDDPSC